MSSPLEGEEDFEGPSTSQEKDGTQPKKGILKRSSMKKEQETKDTVFPSLSAGYRQSPDRFPDKPGTKIPKLQVTWWEKNAVAVFGDTSDENNTDSDQNMMNDLGNGSRNSMKNVRQTAILDSEDEPDDPVVRELEAEAAKLKESHLLEVPHEDILEEEEEYEEHVERDDALSVASSTGSGGSSIVGRWWVGKDTRYVPHCVKRGCKHNHVHDPSEYLTPTQRKNKENNELKKELKSVIQERDEKERHLQELRQQIDEIEKMQDVNAMMTENRSLMASQKEAIASFEKERKQAEKRHGVRVNQLVHETMAAREENAKLTMRVKDLETRYVKTTANAETMTDVPMFESAGTSAQYASSNIMIKPGGYDQSQQIPGIVRMSPVPSITDLSALSPRPVISSSLSPMSTSMEGKGALYLSQDAMNTMQAYQNEAFIWRNKAAQLEIIVKDQLLKTSQQETNLSVETENLRKECQRLRDLLNERTEGGMIDSGIDAPPSPQREIRSTTSTAYPPSECQVTQCIERKKSLIHENNALIETTEEMTIRIREIEEDVSLLQKELEAADESKKKLQQEFDEIVRMSEEKTAETAAANIVVGRLQSEKVTMQKAISYMEERMTAYQNCILDNGLAIQDEETHNWRRGFANPKYIVSMSKKCQTTLTSDALNKHMSEFESVQAKLKAVNEEFRAKRHDLSSRFDEIEGNLLTKTQLVETLSRQIEDTRKAQRSEIERHQQEREQYRKSLESVGAIAQKVPGLETKIEQLQQEKSEFDVKFKEAKEEFDRGLEDALAEALRKYQEQSQYWKDRVASYETTIQKLKNELLQHQREKDDIKIRTKLEKADLEHRLTSSIDHVSLLNREMHKSKRDVEVEAKPRQTSKYVACRPNTKSKGTLIEKGDLFDEQEERLKLCQGELSTTRRQVNMLQQKLITLMQDKVDRSKLRGRLACVNDKEEGETEEKRGEEKDKEEEQQNSDSEESAIKILKQRNAELIEKIDNIEIHKNRLIREERNRIQQLVAEFDNVRQELDQEIRRYESEKKWLKSRIQNLVKANTELEKQIQAKGSPSPALGTPTIRISEEQKHLRSFEKSEVVRKALSEPDLNFPEENEEVSKLQAEIVRLNRELMRVHDRVSRTASAASEASRRSKRSQLSPAFATLVEDINMVKGDLEKVLVRIDEGAVTDSHRKPLESDKSERSEVQSDVLQRVVGDWDSDQRSQLAKDLVRSRQEREYLQKNVDRLHRELTECHNELELLRKEPHDSSTRKDQRKIVKRSKSTVELGDVPSIEVTECKRWQEKAGTMFRELNRLRIEFTQISKDRRELKIQLAMQRGELELTRIQLAEKLKTDPLFLLSHSVIVSGRGSPIMKEMSVPLNMGDVEYRLTERTTPRGSQIHLNEICESPSSSVIQRVSCNIKAPILSKDGDTRRSSTTINTSSKVIQKRPESTKPSRSNHRKRSSPSGSSPGVYRTAPQSLSSLHHTDTQSQPNLHEQLPTVSMTQSWHAGNEDSDSQKTVSKPPRTVHLREKVKCLTRQNQELHSKLESLGKERSVAPVQIVIPNKTSQIELLENENHRLLAENKRLRTELQIPKFKGSTRSLDTDVSRLTDENDFLRKRIEDLENEVKETDSACFSSTNVVALQEENKTLLQENLKLRTEVMDNSDVYTIATEKNCNVNEQVNQMKNELESDKEVISQLEQDKIKAQKETKLLRERIEGLERHMQTEREELIADHTKRVEVLERGRRNVLQENTLMMTKLESMGADLEKKSQHITKLEKENAYIAEDNRCLRSKMESMEESFKESLSASEKEFASKNKKLEEDIARMQKDLEHVTIQSKEAFDAVDIAKTQNKTTTEENAWLKKENETLRENVDELRKELKERLQTVQMVIPKKSKRVECLESDKEELMETNEKLKTENEEMKKKIHTEIKHGSHDVILKLELCKRENEMYEKKIRELEEERSDMYLVMFRKGQQAVKFAARDDREIDQLTEDRITLRFLRDAFFYYLLNKGDEKDHLNAIMTMLDFSSEQKDDVFKKRKTPERK